MGAWGQRIYKVVRLAISLLGLAMMAVALVAVWVVSPHSPLEQAANRARDAQFEKQKEFKLSLCRAAAACKKYGGARLECARAGNFQNCLRIKMGDDSYPYAGTCSGNDLGAPAMPLPLNTPNAVDCFFRTLFNSAS